ncbi:MAG: amidoligase family protein [Ruminococcus sp.]|nr:amidoligase family protein [Ruminococcus sp.]
MAGNFDGIKKQRFGIKIKLTGITRDEAAESIASLFDTDYDHYGGNYDRYDVSDAKNCT